MRFEVEHTTRFEYSEPVNLEPMTIRLRPRTDRSQRLRSFQLLLDPEPAGITEPTDVEGNDTTLVWFSQSVTHFEVRTRLQADTLRTNPFDYVVIDPAALQLPMRYPEAESAALDRYRTPTGAAGVVDLAVDVMRAGGEATDFLTALSARLASEVEGEIRMEGDPLRPSETLARGRGSCRDAAVLFIDACRSVGVAARFVSGYQEGDPDVEEKHLHAWAEAFIPSVGWRGFDPTLGLAVSDRHLAVAAGPTHQSAAPTEGSFRGGARSSMKGHLEVRVGPASRDPVK